MIHKSDRALCAQLASDLLASHMASLADRGVVLSLEQLAETVTVITRTAVMVLNAVDKHLPPKDRKKTS